MYSIIIVNPDNNKNHDDENMKKKATSRGIENMEEEATSSKELDFGEIYPYNETVDTTTDNTSNALIVN